MCDTTCTKYLLFIFNLLFWLIGLALIAIGLWAKLDQDFIAKVMDVAGDSDLAEELSNYITIMAIFIIVLGAIIACIGFFGCCGAMRQSRCCLGIFFFLLLICFLVTIVLGGFLMFVAATANSTDDTSSTVRQWATEFGKMVWELMGDEGRASFEKANHCCGADNNLIAIVKNYKCSITTGTTENCMDKLIENVQNKFWISGGVILCIALIELIGMCMACVLYNRFAHVYTAV